MEPNPYETPRQERQIIERGAPTSDPLLAVLTEIRDAQMELLELHRESVKLHRDVVNRTNMFRPQALLIMILPLAIMAVPLYQIFTRRPTAIPAPRRSIPSSVIPPSPTTVPTAS